MTALFTQLGWIWALAGLATTAAALALAAWRTWRPAVASPVQHRVDVAALALCVGLVAVAPLALTATGRWPRAGVTGFDTF